MTLTAPPATARALTIAEINIIRLFGRYDYQLQVPEALTEEDRRLILLYGDNGVGKTTILRTVFHMLSTATNRGHKTALLSIPFSSFTITFLEGVSVTIDRLGDDFTGAFVMSIRVSGTVIATHSFIDTDGRIDPDDDSPSLRAMEEACTRLLGLDVYYLGDNRQFESDQLPKQSPRRSRERMLRERAAYLNTHGIESEPLPSEDPLDELMERAASWLRSRSLEGVSRGEVQNNTAFTEVLQRIATPSILDDPASESITDISEVLKVVSEQSSHYERFGLLSAIDDARISELLASVAGTSRQGPFLNVLVPYLNGILGRVEALRGLYETVDSFVRSINSFYVDKVLKYSVRNGFQVFSVPDNTELPAHQLSSGERQLLLLFLNLVFVLDRPALFIVDEPELSLNTKWQRRLVSELLGTTINPSAQFLAATHSFEIMGGARDRIVEVIPRKHGSLFEISAGAE
jgi:predicted ATPase